MNEISCIIKVADSHFSGFSLLFLTRILRQGDCSLPVRRCGGTLSALLALLLHSTELQASESSYYAASSPITWILVAAIIFLVFQNIRNRIQLKSLSRIKSAIAKLPVQCGVCDANGRLFFYKDSHELNTDDPPTTLDDLNVELRHELQKVLPAVFELNERKSIEFNSYSTQYKIDITPLSKSDYGVPAVLWIVHDVSDLTHAYDERMQIFQLLQNTLSSIDDAVVSTNCDGEITLVNPSAARMAGVPKSDMLGRPLDEFFLLRDDNDESLVRKVVVTRNSFPFHSELKINGNESLIVDGLITPIIEDRLIVGTVLYFHDSTELVQQEQKLQLALKYAQVSDRVKSDFLAAVCHEFRSSINIIIGYSDLNSVNGSSVQDPNIKNIHDEAEKLLRMFNDILDVSKNNMDTIGISQEPVNLNVFTREMQRIFSRTSAIKKIPLIVSIAPNVPVILSDYKGLRQLLMQLLTQAYSLVSGDSVLLSIRWVNQNLVIDISISTHKGRLYQRQNISIFDHLCKRFNGVLNVNQTTKRISFELVLDNPLVFCEATSLSLPNFNDEKRIERDVVLLVDDIAINLKLLSTMLKMLNIETVSCSTAQDAVAEIAKYRPMAIFMDLWMPDIGGEELARVLDQNPETASIPRILITADTQLDEQLEKLFLQIIYKPLKPKDLQNVVSLIEQQRIGHRTTE